MALPRPERQTSLGGRDTNPSSSPRLLNPTRRRRRPETPGRLLAADHQRSRAAVALCLRPARPRPLPASHEVAAPAALRVQALLERLPERVAAAARRDARRQRQPAHVVRRQTQPVEADGPRRPPRWSRRAPRGSVPQRRGRSIALRFSTYCPFEKLGTTARSRRRAPRAREVRASSRATCAAASFRPPPASAAAWPSSAHPPRAPPRRSCRCRWRRANTPPCARRPAGARRTARSRRAGRRKARTGRPRRIRTSSVRARGQLGRRSLSARPPRSSRRLRPPPVARRANRPTPRARWPRTVAGSRTARATSRSGRSSTRDQTRAPRRCAGRDGAYPRAVRWSPPRRQRSYPALTWGPTSAPRDETSNGVASQVASGAKKFLNA